MKLKNYWAPTPKVMRKLGDAILGAATFVSTYAIAEEIKWLALTSVLAGALGKFITNFFTENENPA